MDEEVRKELEESVAFLKTLPLDKAHDYWHSIRVAKLSLKLQKTEGGNKKVILYASLFHDLFDEKTNNKEVKERAKSFLKSRLDKEDYNKVMEIIPKIKYLNKEKPSSIEEAIVRDADLLDAIGAIGIARAFTFGGKHDREIFNEKPLETGEDSYRMTKHNNIKKSTIHHFYEKLIFIKDRLNTKTAKRIAEERHNFMVMFLKQFFKEWYENEA